MRDIILDEFETMFNATLKRLEECTTANELNLVDESFDTIAEVVLDLAHKCRAEDFFFYTSLRDLLDEKKDEYRTAYAFKENELMEK